MVILYTMKRPIFVRPLSDAERQTLEPGSPNQRMPSLCAVARSCFASADSHNAYQGARNLGYNP
jgi:hypothetical protein